MFALTITIIMKAIIITPKTPAKTAKDLRT
jgi:hypothetical protein